MTSRQVRKKIINDVIYKGKTYHYTWISSDDEKDFEPIKLVAGACFDKNGKLLIMREYGKWRIPGGKPQKGESTTDTLNREMFEEVNIKLEKVKLLGAFKIVGPEPKTDIQYHLCYYAFIIKTLTRKKDPEEGIIHEYIFINPNKVNKYIKWDLTGKAMFKKAKLTDDSYR